MSELPFLAAESILMAAVQRGADRQDAHERLRRHSLAAAERIKEHGEDNDMLQRLASDPAFSGLDLDALLDPARHVGLAPVQVDLFIERVVDPIRRRYAASLHERAELEV
jgi:adenylosuccinate lyase